ncbi:MAG: UTP--glucose-1-phosphate uridylyltransferase GalU [Clostridia bacterium]|nr:UTP--glucose-1-phosphate uridylyltransferase GalU [Clostridia bacterium]
MSVKKAVIPAAGFGTRFLPMTKATPKEMLNIIDKPAIQYIVEEAVQSGIEEILIITMRNKSSIENHFDASPELESILLKQNKEALYKKTQAVSQLADIFYKRQKNISGLGQAILEAKAFVGNEPFAVLLADDLIVSEVPCLKQLISIFEDKKASTIGVQKVESWEVEKYGIVEGTGADHKLLKVKHLVEKPLEEDAPSEMAILGRYVLTPGIFEILENTEPGYNGELQLTDALNTLSKKEEVYAFQFDGTRFDLGDKLGYLKATVTLALQHEELQDDFRVFIKNLSKNL